MYKRQDEGVIFATAYLATFNLFAFSLGALELQGEGHRPKVRSILLPPGIWSVIVGVLLFCFQIHLPNPMGPAIKYVASMNTPLGMMACGAFIAGTKLKGMFRNKGMYGVCTVRLLLIPLLLILISVSYTHLDVYKRQLQGFVDPPFHQFDVGEDQFQVDGFNIPGGTNSVSYTHLQYDWDWDNASWQDTVPQPDTIQLSDSHSVTFPK